MFGTGNFKTVTCFFYVFHFFKQFDVQCLCGAHNIKIVTQQGKVTLRGPVRTEAEKETVQAKATEVAGAANVTSAITVVPAKSGKTKTS